jgi:hypothetical protein
VRQSESSKNDEITRPGLSLLGRAPENLSSILWLKASEDKPL